MTDQTPISEEEHRRRLAAERWEKEFGPDISPRKKLWMIGVFAIAFFGILAAVFNSASY